MKGYDPILVACPAVPRWPSPRLRIKCSPDSAPDGSKRLLYFTFQLSCSGEEACGNLPLLCEICKYCLERMLNGCVVKMVKIDFKVTPLRLAVHFVCVFNNNVTLHILLQLLCFLYKLGA